MSKAGELSGSAEVNKAVKAACRAHSNLNIFAAVVSILEGGHIYQDGGSYAAADRIIDLCKKEQQKCLRRYDAALAVAGRAKASTEPGEG